MTQALLDGNKSAAPGDPAAEMLGSSRKSLRKMLGVLDIPVVRVQD